MSDYIHPDDEADDYEEAMSRCGLDEFEWCHDIGTEYCSFQCPFHHIHEATEAGLKEVEEFRRSLTPEDRAVYDEWDGKKPPTFDDSDIPF